MKQRPHVIKRRIVQMAIVHATTCRRARSATDRAGRTGITLLELMLVLALLVVIGAMAYPSFRVPFQMQTLRKAGEVVRIEWGRARIRAMRTGQIQMFTFEPETGTYTMQPYYTEQSVLEGDLSTAGTMMGGTGAAGMAPTTAGGTIASQPKTLPEGVVFASVQVETDLRALQVQQEMQMTMPGAAGAMGATQIPPILFYPDGTTSDAKVILTNEYQRLYVVVSLRSLTGIVNVSDLVSADELTQLTY